VTLSLQLSGKLIDGGDQIAANLTLLLLPVTLTDRRAWHWQPALPAREEGSLGDDVRRLAARSALVAIRVQVAGLYLHACLGKLSVQEWVDGTALYYWLQHPSVGAPGWLLAIVRPALASSFVVVLTWGVLALELGLAMGLFASERWRWWLLRGGFALHGGIAVVHGLFSFALIMFGALLLFLHPEGRSLALAWPWPSLRPRASSCPAPASASA
jgi:antimicrobial peptide system SdpB family protein